MPPVYYSPMNNRSNSNDVKILALDTSTDACSVALLIGDAYTERFQLAARQQTQILLPMVDDILKETKLSIAEIDVFAFGRGPGSFTGVRIACSVVQAFGFGFHKPVVPVSTLRALAQNAFNTEGIKKVFAYLDARMQEIYFGCFEVDAQGIMQPVSDEQVQDPNTITVPEGYIEVTGYPEAKDIAKIAKAEYELGNTVSAMDALPVYIRDKVTHSRG
jgi:tRNA threonylcarbamoyladenosine biosynthesis protein TsaB